MKISGIELANQIRPYLKAEAERLTENGIKPYLAIITLGEEVSWQTYVSQKLKWAERLSMKADVLNLQNATTEQVLQEIDDLNADHTVHGIIVQRPLPAHIDKSGIISHISPEKDADGFRPDSPYEVPVWLAVKHLLSHISQTYEDSLASFLKSETVAVIGKGETAGAPIASGIRALGGHPTVIDSSTSNSQELLQKSQIIISCAGKQVVMKESMHENQVIIGVGIRKENGKLKGDFDESEAEQSGVIYTPTPGGVGPLNLTFLLQNTLQAAQFARN